MTPLPTCFKKGTVHIWNQSLFSSLILPLTLIASMSDAKIAAMTDDKPHRETRQKIWLSTYASNNPRSDYRWQIDVLYDEWVRRGKPEGYSAACGEEYHAHFG